MKCHFYLMQLYFLCFEPYGLIIHREDFRKIYSYFGLIRMFSVPYFIPTVSIY